MENAKSSKSESVQIFLLRICDEVHQAETKADVERKREAFGDTQFFELVLLRKDKVVVEIYKENAKHHVPHIHISHSDKFDASLSLIDFSVLEGDIDKKSKKFVIPLLKSKQAELLAIWKELQEKEDSVGIRKMINNLGIK